MSALSLVQPADCYQIDSPARHAMISHSTTEYHAISSPLSREAEGPAL